jgi:opacity protein-like surface antigen
MKNKFILAAVAAMYVGIGVMSASAATYVGINGGMSFIPSSEFGEASLDYDDGFIVGGAVGKEFNNYRTEIAIDYQQADNYKYDDVSVSGDYSLLSVTANGYYIIPVSEKFDIYGMVGLGLGKADITNGTMNEDSVVGVGQMGVGVSYSISDTVSTDLGYKYMVTTNTTVNGESFDYSSNIMNIGLRLSF